ncbi:MAG: hypothetical protein SFU83_04010 [Meiothermus sp.]|nr:hypothetical protein [Meiothermus sp.]
MRIVANDHRGVVFTYTGGWECDRQDALSLAVLSNLRQLDRLGRKVFPQVQGWSDSLPPQRQFEDNLLLAQYMGLVIEHTDFGVRHDAS